MNFLKTYILTAVMMALYAGAMAQTTTVQPAEAPSDNAVHDMTMYFINGTTLSYEATDITSVTYLPGVGMKVYLNGETYSVDYLYSQMTKIVYGSAAVVTDNNVNANWKYFENLSLSMDTITANKSNYKYAWGLEYPHINTNRYTTSNNKGNQVVVKKTNDYGVTFSLEWDNSKVANRWTCYTLHAGNSLSNVSRDDNFKVDPSTVVQATSGDYSGSGFSRGHLCPSADRLCSLAQNHQTFFLSNMQPQWQNHNGTNWEYLEEYVRDCADNCDTLYIVKAATIDNVTVSGSTSSGFYSGQSAGNLSVPKYFYMALLAYTKSTNTYNAIGFWTTHENVSVKKANFKFKNYAITIDELEARTGIDFFCNLPDDIEETVEASYTESYWKGLVSTWSSYWNSAKGRGYDPDNDSNDTEFDIQFAEDYDWDALPEKFNDEDYSIDMDFIVE